MTILRIPTVPNSPLTLINDKQTYGDLRLRFNQSLDFVENAEFDSALAAYDDNYQNSQAHSNFFYDHMKSVLEVLKKHFPEKSRVVEVGCGKGDFMELIQSDDYFQAIGYDAAYEGDNPRIHKRYLSSADTIKADLIVLRHVLEHIQAPHQFLSMLKNIFGNAKVYIEVPNYDWITENQAFFDITYEHVNYFSQRALAILFDNPPIAVGLCFRDQYQYIIADIDSLSNNFAQQYEKGEWQNIDFELLFPSLQNKISDIENLLIEGGVAYLWGAATKGCMFLVHCANQNKLLDKIRFVIDVNPNKCGKYLPGSLIPIKAREEFFNQANDGDLLIIANPNYQQEIIEEVKTAGLKNIHAICL